MNNVRGYIFDDIALIDNWDAWNVANKGMRHSSKVKIFQENNFKVKE